MFQKNRIITYLLGLITMLSLLTVSHTTVQAAGEYEGYNAGSSTSYQLYIKKTGEAPNPETDEVVYCYNANRPSPNERHYFNGEEDTMFSKHTKIPGTVENFSKSLDPISGGVQPKHNLSPEELRNAVLKVLYNGFNSQGTNKALQTSLGLSDQEMRDVTQAAIWYFTDHESLSEVNSLGYVSVLGTNANKAYDLLIGKETDENLIKAVPANLTLDIYEYVAGSHPGDPFQNLLGSKFVPEKPEEPSGKEVVISKTKLGGEELAGAKIVITKADGTAVEGGSWTTTTTAKTLKLEAGDYKFHEEAAPTGYKVVNDITFTVDAEGKVTIKDINGNKADNVKVDGKKLTVVDEVATNEVVISKTKLGGEELAGATIVITKADGTAVEGGSWTSTTTAKTLKLEAGDYKFHEEAAPTGYKVVNDITFTVDAEGKVTIKDINGNKADNVKVDGNKLTVVDEAATNEVVISKTKLGGEELAGATIVITKADGTAVEGGSWTSTTTAKTLKLEAGDYKFHEEAAPTGYKVVNDITFTVDAEGKVTIKDINGNKADNVKVDGKKLTVVDEATTVDVTFSKTDVDGKELAGATVEVKDSKGTVVQTWKSTGEAKVIKLVPGSYTFHETAAPEGYAIATDISFTVNEDGTITKGETKVEGNTIVMVDDYKKPTTVDVTFSKTDVAGKELAGATVEVKDSKGTVVQAWKSTGEAKVIKLAPGSYTFHETAAPEGYVVATDISFTVNEDGTITKGETKVEGTTIVMVDDYKKETSETTTATPTTTVVTTTTEPTTTIVTTTTKPEEPQPQLGDATIVKVDQNGNRVPDVVFELYRIVETVVQPEPTETTLEIDVEILELETRLTVLRDRLASESTTNELGETTDTRELELEISQLIDQVEVKKREKEVLSSSTTTQAPKTKTTTELVGRYTTDRNGIAIVSKLKDGKYFFKEISAPKGYTFDSSVQYSFELPGNKNIVIKVVNNKIEETTKAPDTTTVASDTTTVTPEPTTEPTTEPATTTTTTTTTTVASTTVTPTTPTTPGNGKQALPQTGEKESFVLGLISLACLAGGFAIATKRVYK